MQLIRFDWWGLKGGIKQGPLVKIKHNFHLATSKTWNLLSFTMAELITVQPRKKLAGVVLWVEPLKAQPDYPSWVVENNSWPYLLS